MSTATPTTGGESSYQGPETTGWWKEVSCIPLRMDGKLAVVTGANSGIGLAVTGELARRGAKVIMACRDLTRAQAAKDSLLQSYGADNPDSTTIDVVNKNVSSILSPIQDSQLRLEQLDLSSFDSIRNFANLITRSGEALDYLINNAGLILPTYEESQNGQEMQLAVNYLGPVLLTELLLTALKRAPIAKIVNMSDSLHFFGTLHKPSLNLTGKDYGPYVAYNQSKLALTMYTAELAIRLEGTNVIVVSLNPGAVNTGLNRNSHSTLDKMYAVFMRPTRIQPWDAAQQVIHALLRRTLVSGGYYDLYERHIPDRLVLTQSERSWLWDKTKEILTLY